MRNNQAKNHIEVENCVEDVCEIIENIAYKQVDLSKHNTQFQESP